MKKQYQKPFIFTAIILCFLIVWMLTEKQYSKRIAFEELKNRSASVTGALKGSLQSEVRRGKMRIDKINNTLKNVVATTEIETIIIKNNDSILFQIGNNFNLAKKLRTTQKYLLTDNRFVYKEVVNIKGCSSNLRSSQQTIITVLSLNDYHKGIEHSNIHLIFTFFFIT